MIFSGIKADSILPILRPAMRTTHQLTPHGLQRKLITKLLNFVFSQPLDDGDFDCLKGRRIGIDLVDIQVRLVISLNAEDKLCAEETYEAETWIRGELLSFHSLMQQKEDPDSLFFQRKLLIEGDTELGVTIKNILDSIDWEELPHSVKMLLNLLGKRTPEQ